MTTSAARKYLAEVSDGLPLFTNEDSPIEIPPNFMRLTREHLLGDATLWKGFVSCFQAVFGSKDTWGEGFVCDECGKVLPIEETARRCACGGNLLDFHGERQLRRRMERELEPPSVCTLLLSENPLHEVVGFCLGFIGGAERLSQYIASDGHVRGYEDAVAEALGDRGDILFFDETGIRRDSGVGFSPVVLLTRLAFERACQEGVAAVLTWTARKSPMYRICRALGFCEVLETDRGIAFLFLEDFVPALKVMQNKSPRESARILAHLSRMPH